MLAWEDLLILFFFITVDVADKTIKHYGTFF